MLTSALLHDSSPAVSCEAFLSFLHLLVGLVVGTALVVKTRAFECCTWNTLPGTTSASGLLTTLARMLTGRLEATARLLVGGSWLQAGAGRWRGGDTPRDANGGAAVALLHRASAWWLLLAYLHAVAAAVS